MTGMVASVGLVVPLVGIIVLEVSRFLAFHVILIILIPIMRIIVANVDIVAFTIWTAVRIGHVPSSSCTTSRRCGRPMSTALVPSWITSRYRDPRTTRRLVAVPASNHAHGGRLGHH